MKNLITYNLEIVKRLKKEHYTREEVLMIMKEALEIMLPDEIKLISEEELNRIKK